MDFHAERAEDGFGIIFDQRVGLASGKLIDCYGMAQVQIGRGRRRSSFPLGVEHAAVADSRGG